MPLQEYGTRYLGHVLQLEILLREEVPAWQDYVESKHTN